MIIDSIRKTSGTEIVRNECSASTRTIARVIDIKITAHSRKSKKNVTQARVKNLHIFSRTLFHIVILFWLKIC